MSERLNLSDQISNSYRAISQPWDSVGEVRPAVSVLELSRKLDVSPDVVARRVLNGGIIVQNNGSQGQLILVDPNGEAVENIEASSRESAPFKRAVQRADYRSRAPGGGPVVKRRVQQSSLETNLRTLGTGRLKIVEVENALSEREAKRRETKERLGDRWASRDTDIYGKRMNPEDKKRTDSFMSFVYSSSVMSPQRPGRIKELVANAASNDGEVIFINWICPPGTPLNFDEETGKLYRLFANSNSEDGFKKDYRLYPRIDLEKRFAKQVKELGISRATYIKTIADDNPYCLYPACLRLEGEEATLQSIEGYSIYVQEQLNKLTDQNDIWVMRWSELLGPDLFQQFLGRFYNTKFEDLEPYLPSNFLDIELDVLTKHTEPDPKLLPAFKQFAKDVIVQYNVEMDILYEAFGDNVVLAWNESTRRGAMLDALRKMKGRPPIPKMYVLHRKDNEEIVNNY